MRSREAKILNRGATALVGSVLAAGLGWLALHPLFSQPLARLSYDLPFVVRAPRATEPIVLVYLDDYSAQKLEQPLGEAWDRRWHARLLDRLTTDGARLVFFDVIFDAPAEAEADAALGEALARNGRAVLGAGMEILGPLEPIAQQRILVPIRPLRKAAAGWGLLTFRPIDPDYAVRQLYTGTSDLPTATWRAAELLGAEATKSARQSARPRWINYCGPPGYFTSVSFFQLIAPEGLPAGYFRDKIVLVGGRGAVGFVGSARDEFGTPYTRTGAGHTTGLEIHANILQNLRQGDWLMRLAPGKETALVLVFGLLLGGLALLRPLIATLVALAATALILGAVWWAVWQQGTWFNWMVPVAVQLPAGLFWSLGAQYYLEARRRKELRRAFGFYLSPEMADQISNSDFDLRPGGSAVEATIMFTDLEGFTTISENLDPAEVSKTLIAYFERTTACILKRKGTIVKYVGDAVMAGWGAPVAQPDHALLAAEAACDLRCLTDIEARGHRLRTRVGMNTGQVLAGNLGSSFRFDYSMIGDTTNFASRLESLNKYLGTQILLSEATRLQLHDRYVVRPLGEFRVAGKERSVTIHELICRCGEDAPDRAWLDIFAEALAGFRAGELEKARALFQKTAEVRGAADGPSQFYLKAITELSEQPLPADWNGVVRMKEK